MNFYKSLAKRVEELVLAVIALGILVVSIEYVQFFIERKDSIDPLMFLQRVALFGAVILFTAYYFVAYTVYFENQNIEKQAFNFSPRRIIALFINDLLQVTIASWLFAVLLLGHITSIPELQGFHVGVSLSLIKSIFLIMMLWHSVVFVWYLMALCKKSNLGLHGMFVLSYLSFYLLISFIQTHFSNSQNEHLWSWLFIFIYFLKILMIYFFKGVPDIRSALSSQLING